MATTNNLRFYVIDKIFYKKELKYMRRRILLGSSMKRVLKISDKNLKWKMIKKTIKNL